MLATAALLITWLVAPLVLASETNGDHPFADVHLSYAQLVELGGIKIGEPFRHKDLKWVLAVDCNVAGARRITDDPVRRDGARSVRRVASRIEGGRIYIWVLSAPPRNGEPDPECRGAFLGYPHAGRYEVYYKEPAGGDRLLGTADVPEYPMWIPGRPPPR